MPNPLTDTVAAIAELRQTRDTLREHMSQFERSVDSLQRQYEDLDRMIMGERAEILQRAEVTRSATHARLAAEPTAPARHSSDYDLDRLRRRQSDLVAEIFLDNTLPPSTAVQVSSERAVSRSSQSRSADERLARTRRAAAELRDLASRIRESERRFEESPPPPARTLAATETGTMDWLAAQSRSALPSHRFANTNVRSAGPSRPLPARDDRYPPQPSRGPDPNLFYRRPPRPAPLPLIDAPASQISSQPESPRGPARPGENYRLSAPASKGLPPTNLRDLGRLTPTVVCSLPFGPVFEGTGRRTPAALTSVPPAPASDPYRDVLSPAEYRRRLEALRQLPAAQTARRTTSGSDPSATASSQRLRGLSRALALADRSTQAPHAPVSTAGDLNFDAPDGLINALRAAQRTADDPESGGDGLTTLGRRITERQQQHSTESSPGSTSAARHNGPDISRLDDDQLDATMSALRARMQDRFRRLQDPSTQPLRTVDVAESSDEESVASVATVPAAIPAIPDPDHSGVWRAVRAAIAPNEHAQVQEQMARVSDRVATIRQTLRELSPRVEAFASSGVAPPAPEQPDRTLVTVADASASRTADAATGAPVTEASPDRQASDTVTDVQNVDDDPAVTFTRPPFPVLRSSGLPPTQRPAALARMLSDRARTRPSNNADPSPVPHWVRNQVAVAQAAVRESRRTPQPPAPSPPNTQLTSGERDTLVTMYVRGGISPAPISIGTHSRLDDSVLSGFEEVRAPARRAINRPYVSMNDLPLY